jgi:uncharacterized cupredoxin-like copper-binding protein
VKKEMQQKNPCFRCATPARFVLLVPVFVFLPMLFGGVATELRSDDRGAAQDTTTITIYSSGTSLSFDPAEISVKQGTPVRIRYVNEATFAHNMIIVKKDEYIDILGAAAHSASQTGWMPMEHKDKVVAFTPLASPGKTVEVVFIAPPAGEYPFVCLVDGHHNAMVGVFRSRA